tara:strand:+ start:1624 stop:3309 length:1686 start_codon:yes stop_codon:yes gene_type:complete
MLIKKYIFLFIICLFYQNPLYSKSNSFNDVDSKNLSKYFSGIVAYENNENTTALNFFNSSKILLDKHDPFLKRYIFSLVLENKVQNAISVVKKNNEKSNSNFFDAYLLLILDSLKKNDFNKADLYLQKTSNLVEIDRFNLALLESIKQFIYVFKEKKILNNKKNLGKLSMITETFQRCYLGDGMTDNYFLNLINDNESDYTRYIFFYLSYLIENNRVDDAKKIISDLDFINTTLLLSQGKSWLENSNIEKITNVFSCKNSNDIMGEFLFLISNLYSAQDNFEKSNFYLNLSNYLNPKFIFNLSLVAENQYLNGEYKKAQKTLKNFKKDSNFYYWYRIKKEAQIIAKTKNKEQSLNFIKKEFKKIEKPNNKILFDLANFYKNFKKYDEAIKYYSILIKSFDDFSEIESDLFYRRGGSYERIGKYDLADKDLLKALSLNPNDAYILNYLAYSWLERNFKIDDAIKMLEKAYSLKNNDPYIIDSIGWAYYLIDDFHKAEKFLKRAVELMPDDPIVNDHYGDILWKLNRKIQARYFWSNVLKMDDTEKEIIKKINIKLINGLENS